MNVSEQAQRLNNLIQELLQSGWKVWNVAGVLLYAKGKHFLDLSHDRMTIVKTYVDPETKEVVDEETYSGDILSIDEINNLVN